jgi:hypothetical protein
MSAFKLNTTEPHLKNTAQFHRPMAPFVLPTTIPKQAKAAAAKVSGLRTNRERFGPCGFRL